MLMPIPIGQNSPFYNMTSGIEKNAVLNRGLLDVFGIEVPFAWMANNRDERIERFARASLFLFASFIAPVITMPLINKFVLRHHGIIKNSDEANILRVSKKYLTKNSDYMIEGFKKTANELEKNEKYKEISKKFENVLNSYTDKEKLREKLIKAHQHIYSLDFGVASVLAVSIPWLSNFITEKRTKRVGYVGEFKMADQKYTDLMAEKHEKYKKYKMALSYLFALTAAVAIPKMLGRSMLLQSSKLSSLGKFLKEKAHHFDYTDTIFMSKAAYLGIMVFGDLPSYALACRDKHELKYRSSAWAYMVAMFFGGDFLLNNIFGRLSDKKLKTTIMKREGFEKAGFWKKFLMPVTKFEKLNSIPNVTVKTKKIALCMYWANFILTTALLGFGLPYFLNRGLKKDVTKEQKAVFKNKPYSTVSIYEYLKNIENKKPVNSRVSKTH
jgi:hypothetical protein